MKKLVPIALALCIYATFCSPGDTARPDSWRTIAPMLSDAPAWIPCQDAECSRFPGWQKLDCSNIADHTAAFKIVSSYTDCVDEAIATLEKLAPGSVAARNDLAAAYYLRAERQGQPSDLLRALSAAERAAAPRPQLAAAVFNNAFLLEKAGLYEQSLTAWNQFLQLDRTDWSIEARTRRDAVRRLLSGDAAALWAKNRLALPAALRAGDRAAVARLVAPARSGAQAYLENELLAAWADSASPQLLADARLLASVLSTPRDRYPADIVDAAASTRGGAAVREGHRRLASARDLFRGRRTKEAAAQYEQAARALLEAGSPLHLAAQIETATALTFLDRTAEALRLIAAAERDLRARPYPRLTAYAHGVRGYAETWTNPVAAVETYGRAIAEFSALQDEENVAGMYARRAGVYSLLGHNELALQDALEAVRRAPSIIDSQRAHAVLGEIGRAVLDAGETGVALHYQNRAVSLLERELNARSQMTPGQRVKVLKNLGIAKRERARIYADLGQYTFADRDLQDAARFIAADQGANAARDDSYLRMLRAHAEETRGRVYLKRAPHTAVDAFTSALGYAARDEFLTFRARLFAQLAEAKSHAGYAPADVKRDLTESVKVLEQEEQYVLERRQRGENEILWTPYFSRFEDTYQRLIQVSIDTGDDAGAFEIAERRRAVELRDLLDRFDRPGAAAPADTPGRGELSLIQSVLPPGTFLLEYVVLPDRTYCWVISGGKPELIRLAVGGEEIQKWLTVLQTEARKRLEDADVNAFHTALEDAYAALFAEPMRRVRASGTRMPRIIVVPDGAMHGLPLPALLDRTSGRHLIEDAIVSISGSAALYRHSLRRNGELSSDDSPTLLLVGDPEFDRNMPVAGDLPSLPGAVTEVGEIASAYGSAAETLLKEEATVEEFLARARTKTVVHFAGHAIVNQTVPARSMLLMARSKEDPGALYAGDLLRRLQLDRTRLVVLAACSSAGGLPIRAEGVGPLVRPLIAARVPAVIGSLWPVSDATATHLFVSFHQRFGEGRDAAAAMQAAQRGLIRSDDRKSVFAWAPYQVIGYTDSPFGPAQK